MMSIPHGLFLSEKGTVVSVPWLAMVAAKAVTRVQGTGRWKLHSVPSHSGPVGAYAVLQQKKWRVHEILHMNDKHCVFIAKW